MSKFKPLNMQFLSLLTAVCPAAAAPPTIIADDCHFYWGQTWRLILQRLKSGTTRNSQTLANAALQASWTTLTTAVDGTKAQFTPIIANPENEPQGPREDGGGNATPGGIPIILGPNPSPFTCEMLNKKTDLVDSVAEWGGEPALQVYLVNEVGNMLGKTDGTNFMGIPIYSFFVNDRQLGGFEGNDKNTIQFSFAPSWSKDLAVVTPTDFDALVDF